jgi:hypothetical protein
MKMDIERKKQEPPKKLPSKKVLAPSECGRRKKRSGKWEA